MDASDLRIALFSGNYNYVRDGANQSLNLLARHLLDRGVTLRVYSPTVDMPAFPPTGDLVSVPSVPMIGGRGEYRVALGLTPQVKADLEAFAPTVVHVSAPEFLGHAAVRWAKKNGVPALASFHTRFETYFRYYGADFIEPLIASLMTRFYNKFDRVMVPSPSMVDLVRDWGVTAPVSIWSRGIDHDRFRPDRRSLEWRRAMGIADDDVAVGFLGRLVKEKGLDVFAEVLDQLRARAVPLKVLAIGKGPAQGWFAERAPDTIFAGHQSGNDLGRAVAAMDVFFNPSISETFGNVTTEAMASGVPVVAARATGAVDLVEDGVTGFLVDPADIDGYADAIAHIVADPALRRAMGAAGHQKAQRYRWDTANQAVLDAYLELAAPR
ncbi:glycosyltransferase involved in cell wall biosynthesis [Sphingomonas jejuensis]|uniref:Glycosyltransferase involved in cell wall biosynthesis n=1 Tax=Sphingomonas jejuensis TaxID=904715 RepID=A0ABX0XJ75_9SPHN|nr:glycosyltransferase family 1 protein [Sphingomonas jejuensis]NJC33388.1 glycosyltransferase involved in cell wall biosynthesis [Sphingomonas jejuensis]